MNAPRHLYTYSGWKPRKFQAIRWIRDSEGDIGIELFKLLCIFKYKQSTLFFVINPFKRSPFSNALKYQGCEK